MAEKKNNKKKKNSSAAQKKPKARKPASKTIKKKAKSPSKAKSSSKKNVTVKKRKIKKLTRTNEENLFADKLPDWIISSRAKQKNRANKKILIFLLFFSFLILLFFLRSSVFKPNTDHSPKKLTTTKIKAVKSSPDKKEIRKIIPVNKSPAPVKIIPNKPKNNMLSKKNGPYLVFVLDDLGNTKKDQHLLIALGNNITYAILPLLPHSKYFAQLSRETGAEILLHLPIESKKGNEKDPGKLSPIMNRKDIIAQLNEDINSVPYCIGANNHKGSLGTSDIRLMRIVLYEIKQRGMFFLDSYTTGDSVVSSICKQLELPILKRDVFLDNDESPDKINIQISRLADIAREKGYAIGIGHYKHNTLEVLNQRIPDLKKKGFSVINLTRLKKIVQ